MTEETKKIIMENVSKVANHFNIPNANLVSFKKRNVLLELLNTKDNKAFEIINILINSYLKIDRIENDKEKQIKKPEHWNMERAAALNEKDKAEFLFNQFLISNKI
jgi:hypothetical protein